MNTEEYWERFAHTGDIRDYLGYRGMETCRQAWDRTDNVQNREMSTDDQTGEEIDESINNGNWYGVIRNAYRGVR